MKKKKENWKKKFDQQRRPVFHSNEWFAVATPFCNNRLLSVVQIPRGPTRTGPLFLLSALVAALWRSEKTLIASLTRTRRNYQAATSIISVNDDSIATSHPRARAPSKNCIPFAVILGEPLFPTGPLSTANNVLATISCVSIYQLPAFFFLPSPPRRYFNSVPTD